MATVGHVTAWAGRTKYQAVWFLLNRVYMWHVTDILTLAEFSKEEMVSSLGISWVPARGGSVPEHAVLAGRDLNGGPIYVGRARFSSDLLSAKVVPKRRTAFVSFAGKEHRVVNYEVKTATAFHCNTSLFSIREILGLCVGQETTLTGLFLSFRVSTGTYQDWFLKTGHCCTTPTPQSLLFYYLDLV